MDVQIGDPAGSMSSRDWLRIARAESRRGRWQGQGIDPQDVEGAVLERFVRQPPANAGFAAKAAEQAAYSFAREWFHNRAGRGRAGAQVAPAPQPDTCAETLALEAIDVQQLAQVLLQLPRQQRVVARLTLDGRDVAEIATTLDVSTRRIREIKTAAFGAICAILGADSRSAL
jgi:DNA-directed RNA polymerase specialized sigma24 family protein